MKMNYSLFLIVSGVFVLSNSDLSWFVIQFFILISLINFLNPWNHLLLSLLNLELVSLLVIASFSILPSTGLAPEFFFSFFTLAVCEASLGIAILIFFSHAKGSESLSSLLSVL